MKKVAVADWPENAKRFFRGMYEALVVSGAVTRPLNRDDCGIAIALIVSAYEGRMPSEAVLLELERKYKVE